MNSQEFIQYLRQKRDAAIAKHDTQQEKMITKALKIASIPGPASRRFRRDYERRLAKSS